MPEGRIPIDDANVGKLVLYNVHTTESLLRSQISNISQLQPQHKINSFCGYQKSKKPFKPQLQFYRGLKDLGRQQPGLFCLKQCFFVGRKAGKKTLRKEDKEDNNNKTRLENTPLSMQLIFTSAQSNVVFGSATWIV